MAKKEIVIPKPEDLFISYPFPVNSTYHVFNKSDRRSLCGRFAMLIVTADSQEPVTGNETYKKGQDCKSCFKKAGLKVD